MVKKIVLLLVSLFSFVGLHAMLDEPKVKDVYLRDISDAIKTDDSQKIHTAFKEALKHDKFDFDACINEQTLLFHAVDYGLADIVTILLCKGAKYKDPFNYRTALHHAARYSNSALRKRKCTLDHYSEVVKKLLGNIGIDERDYVGNTPLYYAMDGDTDILLVLLEKGASTQVENALFGYQPLHRAALYCCVDAVKVLLGNGANVDALDTMGNTPVHVILNVVRNRWFNTPPAFDEENLRSVAIVRELLEHGAKTNTKNAFDSRMPLQMVIGKSPFAGVDPRYVPMIEVLLENDACMDDLDVSDLEHLHKIKLGDKARSKVSKALQEIQSGRFQLYVVVTVIGGIVCYLIHHVLSNKQTELHKTASNGNRDKVNTLLEQGADKNARDSHGRTPLHCAALKGHSVVVKVLLDSGADKEIKDNYGKIALQLAADSGHVEIVKLFGQHGMFLTVQDSAILGYL